MNNRTIIAVALLAIAMMAAPAMAANTPAEMIAMQLHAAGTGPDGLPGTTDDVAWSGTTASGIQAANINFEDTVDIHGTRYYIGFCIRDTDGDGAEDDAKHVILIDTNKNLGDGVRVEQIIDYDIGGVLQKAVFAGTISYADSDGTAGWSAGDPVYYDIGTTGAVAAGDLRITSVTSSGTTYPAGSQVVGGDEDAADTLLPVPPVLIPPLSIASLGGVMTYNDTDNSTGYNAGDQVYWDADGNHAVSLNDIRLANPLVGAVGDQVAGESDDGNLTLPMTGAMEYNDADTSGDYNVSDPVYWDADGNGVVTVDDIRLANPPHGLVGSQVAAGDADAGSSNLRIKCIGAYGTGTPVYLDSDNDDEVSALDVRLTPVTEDGVTYPAGSKVTATGNDVGLSITDLSGNFDYYENGAAGGYDAADHLYYDVSTLTAPGTTSNVAMNDLRMSLTAGVYGSQVGTATAGDLIVDLNLGNGVGYGEAFHMTLNDANNNGFAVNNDDDYYTLAEYLQTDTVYDVTVCDDLFVAGTPTAQLNDSTAAGDVEFSTMNQKMAWAGGVGKTTFYGVSGLYRDPWTLTVYDDINGNMTPDSGDTMYVVTVPVMAHRNPDITVEVTPASLKVEQKSHAVVTVERDGSPVQYAWVEALCVDADGITITTHSALTNINGQIEFDLEYWKASNLQITAYWDHWDAMKEPPFGVGAPLIDEDDPDGGGPADEAVRGDIPRMPDPATSGGDGWDDIYDWYWQSVTPVNPEDLVVTSDRANMRLWMEQVFPNVQLTLVNADNPNDDNDPTIACDDRTGNVYYDYSGAGVARIVQADVVGEGGDFEGNDNLILVIPTSGTSYPVFEWKDGGDNILDANEGVVYRGAVGVSPLRLDIDADGNLDTVAYTDNDSDGRISAGDLITISDPTVIATFNVSSAENPAGTETFGVEVSTDTNALTNVPIYPLSSGTITVTARMDYWRAETGVWEPDTTDFVVDYVGTTTISVTTPVPLNIAQLRVTDVDFAGRSKENCTVNNVTVYPGEKGDNNINPPSNETPYCGISGYHMGYEYVRIAYYQLDFFVKDNNGVHFMFGDTADDIPVTLQSLSVVGAGVNVSAVWTDINGNKSYDVGEVALVSTTGLVDWIDRGRLEDGVCDPDGYDDIPESLYQRVGDDETPDDLLYTFGITEQQAGCDFWQDVDGRDGKLATIDDNMFTVVIQPTNATPITITAVAVNGNVVTETIDVNGLRITNLTGTEADGSIYTNTPYPIEMVLRSESDVYTNNAKVILWQDLDGDFEVYPPNAPLDPNHPFGNGLDDDGDGVTDEYGEDDGNSPYNTPDVERIAMVDMRVANTDDGRYVFDCNVSFVALDRDNDGLCETPVPVRLTAYQYYHADKSGTLDYDEIYKAAEMTIPVNGAKDLGVVVVPNPITAGVTESVLLNTSLAGTAFDMTDGLSTWADVDQLVQLDGITFEQREVALLNDGDLDITNAKIGTLVDTGRLFTEVQVGNHSYRLDTRDKVHWNEVIVPVEKPRVAYTIENYNQLGVLLDEMTAAIGWVYKVNATATDAIGNPVTGNAIDDRGVATSIPSRMTPFTTGGPYAAILWIDADDDGVQDIGETYNMDMPFDRDGDGIDDAWFADIAADGELDSDDSYTPDATGTVTLYVLTRATGQIGVKVGKNDKNAVNLTSDVYCDDFANVSLPYLDVYNADTGELMPAVADDPDNPDFPYYILRNLMLKVYPVDPNDLPFRDGTRIDIDGPLMETDCWGTTHLVGNKATTYIGITPTGVGTGVLDFKILGTIPRRGDVVYGLIVDLVVSPPEIPIDATTTLDITIRRQISVLATEIVKDATVTATKCGVNESGVTDASGKVSIDVTPTSKGRILITATKPGFVTGTYEVTVATDTAAPVISNNRPTGTTDDQRPAIGADYTDTHSGIDKSSVQLTLDGNDVTPNATVTIMSVIYTPQTNLTDGVHNVVVAVSDKSENSVTSTWSFAVGTAYDSADTNQDCEVSNAELMTQIGKWKSGTVESSELMASIGNWKKGAGGYC